MGFGWAPTDLLMVDETVTADRIQTLNQHEQFDFIKLYNQKKQSDFIEDSPFTGKQTSCNYYTPDEFSNRFIQTTKSLSLFCINCRSLNAHWDALNDLLYTMCVHNFLLDFIGLTEVFHIENDQHFTLKGYHQLEFNTRPSSDDAHGGVALFINDKLNYIRRDDLSIFIPHVMETLFVEIQYKHSKPIIVGVIYRPNTLPRADLDLFISNLLEIQSKISNENKISYLMGDYNINLLNFGIHSKTN